MLTRTELYDELEADKHFVLKIHELEAHPSDVPDYLMKRIQRKQNGKEYHGQLVAIAHKILEEHYDLYSSVHDCYQNTNIEATGTGLHCDLFDESNKFIIECGFLLNFDERWPLFLDKSVQYANYPGPIWENATEYTFVHVPKSFLRDKEDFKGNQKIIELDNFHFFEIKFTEEFIDKSKDFHYERMEEVRENVNKVAENLL